MALRSWWPGDSDYPQIADLTAPFVYARIMGTREADEAGYPDDALDLWTQRARLWASGKSPDGLETVDTPREDESRAGRFPLRHQRVQGSQSGGGDGDDRAAQVGEALAVPGRCVTEATSDRVRTVGDTGTPFRETDQIKGEGDWPLGVGSGHMVPSPAFPHLCRNCIARQFSSPVDVQLDNPPGYLTLPEEEHARAKAQHRRDHG